MLGCPFREFWLVNHLSPSAAALEAMLDADTANTAQQPARAIAVRGARTHNLKNIDVYLLFNVCLPFSHVGEPSPSGSGLLAQG